MGGEGDGGKQVKAENAHNGLAVYNVSAGLQINVNVAFGNNVYKITHVGDGGKTNAYAVHTVLLIFYFGEYRSAIIISDFPILVNAVFIKSKKIRRTS